MADEADETEERERQAIIAACIEHFRTVDANLLRRLAEGPSDERPAVRG